MFFNSCLSRSNLRSLATRCQSSSSSALPPDPRLVQLATGDPFMKVLSSSESYKFSICGHECKGSVSPSKVDVKLFSTHTLHSRTAIVSALRAWPWRKGLRDSQPSFSADLALWDKCQRITHYEYYDLIDFGYRARHLPSPFVIPLTLLDFGEAGYLVHHCTELSSMRSPEDWNRAGPNSWL
eukprot:gb/GEZN01021522.1/.p1 GENE.gb/GEZN01021522.1/~~gb/GEZN01021522.1/.p1  ORF type:complete len:182 (+),score=9.02 gb/GEZN01021522.1/:20-565(+)